LTPIFGAIFFRNTGLAVGIEEGGGDDGGAGKEIDIEGTTTGREAGGGDGSFISSTVDVSSEIK
jgi:hypothetical protein